MSVAGIARCLYNRVLPNLKAHSYLIQSPKCFSVTSKMSLDVYSSLKINEIVPDVIDKPASESIEVTYNNGKEVKLGNELTPTEVKDIPVVKYNADDNSLYTLIMTDPDAPSRKNPEFREWHHWLVINIPGGDVSKGETLSEYIGSGPPEGTGLHRYIFLLFKQSGTVTPIEKKLTNRSGDGRGKFSTRTFADTYSLGDPIAANFYVAQWDDYVPILYKQLGE